MLPQNSAAARESPREIAGNPAHGQVATLREPEAARVAVILVHFHAEEWLRRSLDALQRQTRPPDRILVVDNGSGEADLSAALTSFPQVELLRPGRNLGFAAGNNLAVAAAVDCSWIALLNVDALPAPDWLQQLLAAAEQSPECVAFGSQLLVAEDPQRLDGSGDVYHCSGRPWRRDHGQPVAEGSVETAGTVSPCAAAALYQRAAWLHVGGLDEHFFCYLEDVDLGLRLALAGYRYRYVPSSHALHAGSAVTGRHSSFYVYHGQRNLVWTYFKNMPGWLFWKYLPQHLLLNILGLVWFIIKGRGLSILRAKWDALRGLPRVWRQRQAIQKKRRISVRDFDSLLAHGPRGLFTGR